MRRSPAAPALPSLFDEESPSVVTAAPMPAAIVAAPVKAGPVKAASAPKSAAPKPPVKPAAAQPAPKPVTKPAAKDAPTVKSAPKPATKVIPVKAITPAPAAPVRVIAETGGPGGRAWKLGGRHAVAYLMDSVLAGELLATEPKHLARAAMAVYYDRKGKAFAWQVRFDTERWDEVVRRLTA